MLTTGTTRSVPLDALPPANPKNPHHRHSPPPYLTLTRISPQDTTYIYTRNRQSISIAWDSSTRTYQTATYPPLQLALTASPHLSEAASGLS